MDTLTPTERSRRMSLVRASRNHATELKLLELLRAAKLRGWRRNARVFGKPDFVWPTARVAVFVDGCFWHCCPRHTRIPKTRHKFWVPKLARNRARDVKVNRKLRQEGWIVVRIWECEMRRASVSRKLRRIACMILREI